MQHANLLNTLDAIGIDETRLPPLKQKPPAGQVTVQMLPFTGLPVTIGDGIYQRFRIQAHGAPRARAQAASTASAVAGARSAGQCGPQAMQACCSA